MTSAFQYFRLAAVPGIALRVIARENLRSLRVIARENLRSLHVVARESEGFPGFGGSSADRPRLVCRWHRDAFGKLSCFWEPDIVPVPRR